MTHYGLFIGRDLLDYAVSGGPQQLIVADTETEVWQHLFDLVAAHLQAGAANPELRCAGDYQRLLADNPPSDGIRADQATIRQWLDHVDGYAEVFHLVFNPRDVRRLPALDPSRRNDWLTCTHVYFADLRDTDQWAFCFRGPRGGEVIVYLDSPEAYRVGASYIITTPPSATRPGSAQRPSIGHSAQGCIATLEFAYHGRDNACVPAVLLADSPRQARVAAIAEISRYVDGLDSDTDAEDHAELVARFLAARPFPGPSGSDTELEAWLQEWNNTVESPWFTLHPNVIDARA